MFDRFNWLSLDPALFIEDSTTRWAKAKQLANDWSGWSSQARRYRDEFENGDESAIFKFARKANAVLLAPWVLTVLRRWQSSGRRSDRQRIKKFINAWVDSRGKRPPANLFAMIRRDKDIECRVLDTILAGKTKEVAIEHVSTEVRVPESIVAEIHREYWKRGRRLFRHRRSVVRPEWNQGRLHLGGAQRPERAFRDYLHEATPESVWDRVVSALDEESSAYFIDMEIRSLSRDRRIRLDDLHETDTGPGRFFDDLLGSLADGERLEIKVLRRVIADESALNGDYIRLDLSRRSSGPMFFKWEPSSEVFHRVRRAGRDWIRDLDSGVR